MFSHSPSQPSPPIQVTWKGSGACLCIGRVNPEASSRTPIPAARGCHEAGCSEDAGFGLADSVLGVDGRKPVSRADIRHSAERRSTPRQSDKHGTWADQFVPGVRAGAQCGTEQRTQWSCSSWPAVRASRRRRLLRGLFAMSRCVDAAGNVRPERRRALPPRRVAGLSLTRSRRARQTSRTPRPSRAPQRALSNPACLQ